MLLAGEGPLLRIYDQKKIQLLLSDRIFESRVIHGLCAEATTDHSDDRTHCGRILIWGGRSVCLLAIDINAVHEDQYDVQIRPIMREIQVDDWIFDACFSPIAYSGPVPESIARGCNAVLVTAHNDLLALNTQPDSNSGIGAIPSFKCIAAGPQSILYSAHVTWPRNGRGLVAAGTVFGEVLLWSFSPDQFFLDSELVIPGHLHYRFTGHEGSIFGVQMSEEFVISGVGLPRRILASCSDDRTIKIWDISNLELDRDGNEAQSLSSKPNIEHSGDNSKSKENSCLAEVMGHNSRIWGVRFLFQQTNSWRLISYGEDATAQIWQLRFNSSDSVSSEKFTSHATILFHQSSYAYHSGKNIWSLATYTETTCESMIYTGGADGRIVSYTVKSEDFPWANNSQSSQWSIEEAYLGANTNTAHAQGILSVESTSKQPSPSQKVLFQSLQGKWLLHRDLNSAITTYPSGSFKGTAVFEARKPTDEAYDLEYLYVESGKYTAAQGFSMEATRRYAYRFQQRTNTITVWFISTEDQSTIDYLFHVLNFESPSKDLETKNHYGVITLRATGDHLCIDDNYQASYQFQIGTAALTSWDLKYNVKGPNKDYVANANYVRGGDMEQPAAIIETVNPKSQSVEASNNPTGLAEKKPDPDSFKNYAWLDQDCLITSTEKGTILLGNLPRKAESYKVGRTMFDSSIESWTFFGQVNELKSYCTITSTRSCQMAVLGGSEGDLYLYRYPGQLLHLTKLPRKIAFLPAHMLPLGSVFLTEEQGQVSSVVAIFASCLGYSTAHLLIIGAGESGQNDTQNLSSSSANIEVLQNVRIDLPPHFVATSALMIESQGLLILGSRSGRLSIYDLLADADDCGTCIFLSENIHGNGEDLITMIQSVPDAISGSHSKDFYILTTGRDGNYSVQQMFVERIENGKPRTSLRIVHRCAPPFSPNVEGARFLEETNDLLLWGFRSKRFVVWNETQKTELMNVDCGGANRNWAYTPQSDASGGGRFVWTKASICNIHSQRQASHQVLQHGGHGREIKAMAIFPQIIGGNSFSSKIIATGAEDTAIRIFSYEYECTKRKAQGFKCLGIFTNHKAGVQQLKWSSDGKYLFSAAGFEEFFIWRVRSVPCIGVGVVCEARFPPVTEPSDLRIMDFDILEIGSEKGDEYILSLVCSDSSLRVRITKPNPKFFTVADTSRSTTTTPINPTNP